MRSGRRAISSATAAQTRVEQVAQTVAEAIAELADERVGIDEAGHDRLAAAIEHAGPAPDEAFHAGIGSDSDDAAVLDRDGLRDGALRIHGADGGALEHEIGGEHHTRYQGLSRSVFARG